MSRISSISNSEVSRRIKCLKTRDIRSVKTFGSRSRPQNPLMKANSLSSEKNLANLIISSSNAACAYPHIKSFAELCSLLPLQAVLLIVLVAKI